MKLLHSITLASILIVPQVANASDNKSLHDYCSAIAELGPVLNENKSKGITYDQAVMINKLTLLSKGMNLEYLMSSALLVRVYDENITNTEAYNIGYNGCVKYLGGN